MTHKKTSFQELNLSNGFLFAAAMEDEETCRMVVETILGKKIGKVTVQVEKSILYNSEFRSVRLDVFARDEAEITYNLEMQNKDKDALAQRSRFYQAQMDVNSLRPGEDYRDLPPVYVIFICNFDPFDKGLYQYTFVEQCREADFSLEDGTTRIFINTKGVNSQDISKELLHLLQYINDSTNNCAEHLADENICKLHKRVETLKKNRTLERNYMRLDEYIHDEAEDLAKEIAEDMAKEIAEGMTKNMATRMLTLVAAMHSGGDADKIPLLKDDKVLLNDMFEKYNL